MSEEPQKLTPPADALASFIVENDFFVPSLAKLVPCMGKDEKRYYLQGIRMKAEADELTLCATNGLLLGLIETPVADESVLTPFEVIIPAATVKSLIKLLPLKSRCIITVFYTKLLFEWEDGIYESRTLDGEFPNLDTLISPAIVEFDEPTVCFNPKLLSMMSKAVDGTMIIKTNRKNDPVLIKDSHKEGSTFLLMPARWDETQKDAEAAKAKAEAKQAEKEAARVKEESEAA